MDRNDSLGMILLFASVIVAVYFSYWVSGIMGVNWMNIPHDTLTSWIFWLVALTFWVSVLFSSVCYVSLKRIERIVREGTKANDASAMKDPEQRQQENPLPPAPSSEEKVREALRKVNEKPR